MDKKELQKLREEYSKNILDEKTILPDPIQQFEKWLDEAVKSHMPEPNAMNVATVGVDGRPHSRYVLLKELEDGKFVFYTNYHSNKGMEIDANPNVAISFLWLELERQVRIEGVARKISRERSRQYFKTRPFKSRLGALASNQSKVIAGREQLDAKYRKLEVEYKGKEVEMPGHWGGYEVEAHLIEFWQGRKNRLHDRIRYKKIENKWIIERLEP